MSNKESTSKIPEHQQKKNIQQNIKNGTSLHNKYNPDSIKSHDAKKSNNFDPSTTPVNDSMNMLHNKAPRRTQSLIAINQPHYVPPLSTATTIQKKTNSHHQYNNGRLSINNSPSPCVPAYYYNNRHSYYNGQQKFNIQASSSLSSQAIAQVPRSGQKKNKRTSRLLNKQLPPLPIEKVQESEVDNRVEVQSNFHTGDETAPINNNIYTNNKFSIISHSSSLTDYSSASQNSSPSTSYSGSPKVVQMESPIAVQLNGVLFTTTTTGKNNEDGIIDYHHDQQHEVEYDMSKPRTIENSSSLSINSSRLQGRDVTASSIVSNSTDSTVKANHSEYRYQSYSSNSRGSLSSPSSSDSHLPEDRGHPYQRNSTYQSKSYNDLHTRNSKRGRSSSPAVTLSNLLGFKNNSKSNPSVCKNDDPPARRYSNGHTYVGKLRGEY